MHLVGSSAGVVGLFVAALTLRSAACQPTPPPAAPVGLTSDQVTGELVDAGCLAPGSSDAVAAELATGHDPWLACLYEGGSIVQCNAPCARAGYVRKP